MSAPPLKSRRLELRPLAPGDAEALYAAVDDSRSELKRRMRWVGGVQAPADAAAFIAAAADRAQRAEAVVFGIFEQKSGELVGVAALQGLLAAPGIAELCGWVRSDRGERGYALEAGRLMIAQALKRESLHRLYARIDPSNRAARRVLQKLGFRYEGCLRREKRLNNRWIDQECWGLLREEWKKA